MDFGINRNFDSEMTAKGHIAMQNANSYTPRPLREQLKDLIAGHKAKIADLEEALEALTPDVERALNALQKIRQ